MSNVRPANDKIFPNIRADLVTSPEVIKLLQEDNFEADDPTSKNLPNEEDPSYKNSTQDSSLPSSSARPMPVVSPN